MRHNFKQDSMDRHIGAAIKFARMRAGVSQRDLANVLGVSFQQVQKYECADNRIGATHLYQICCFLEMSIDDIFTFACDVPHIDKKAKETVTVMGLAMGLRPDRRRVLIEMLGALAHKKWGKYTKGDRG